MQYMLLIYDAEKKFAEFSEQKVQEIMEGFGAFDQQLEAAGICVASERLRPVGTATSVRSRAGELMTTDGPFTETKEQLGGFFIIDVDHLDEAIRWAQKIPVASFGCIEVRPVWPREEYVSE